MIVSGIGPQAGAGMLLGGADLPSNPVFRQVFMTPDGQYNCYSDGNWTLLEQGSGSGEVTGAGTTNRLTKWINGAGSVVGDSALLDDGVNVTSIRPITATNFTDSGLTAGRVTYAGTAGLLSDDSGFTYNSGTHALTATTFVGALTGIASGNTFASVVPSTLPSAGQILVGNAGGTAYAPVPMSGDATLGSTGAITLASTISAGGPTGSATAAPIITYDAKGRLTTVSSATITPAVGSITGLGTGVGTALGVNVGTAGAFVVNGGALGSPSTAGTLPAHTLGGTISGGGNQINNVVIGASTPLAGTFTTLVGTTVNGLTITNNGTNTLSITAGKTLTTLKTISLTAADDTGVYTLPTGTKTLLATDGVGTSLTGIPYTLTGTSNQVTLSAGTGNITFSLPQSIATTSTPQFARIGLGAASVSNYGVASTLNLAVSGTNSLQAFGVGVPGDANTEYVDIFHNGASNAFFIVNKSGSGSYRALDIRTGGNQTMLLGTDQSVTFLGVIKNTGITSDATHTDATVCVDTTSKQFYSGSAALGVCLGTSSARYKKGIKALNTGLAAVMKLNPISYRLKKGGSKDLYGFTAEDTFKPLPELVGLDTKGRPNSIDMMGLIPVLVNAIKDLAAQNNLLNTRLNTLLV
jgi:hypothetical protein